MSPSTPPAEQRRSLLSQLNPYVNSPERGEPSAGHDSPSTLLLRELQGSDAGPASPLKEGAGTSTACHTPRIRDTRDVPTPTRSRPLYNLESSSSSEDEGPPKSIMFGDNEGDRTPRSPEGVTSSDHARPGGLPAAGSPVRRTATFRQVDAVSNGASYALDRSRRSSSSRSPSRSRSPSPGPSSISAYASGLEGTVADSVRPSEPETSPGAAASILPRRVPTFRDPPGVARNSPSTKTGRHPHDYEGSHSNHDSSHRQGYLDPPVPPPGPSKGKAKAKQSGGRRYEALPAAEEEQGIDDPQGAVDRKVGMNNYEKALWKWVNVEDLDGFLQEVSLMVTAVARTLTFEGLRVLQGQGTLVYPPRKILEPGVSVWPCRTHWR